MRHPIQLPNYMGCLMVFKRVFNTIFLRKWVLKSSNFSADHQSFSRTIDFSSWFLWARSLPNERTPSSISDISYHAFPCMRRAPFKAILCKYSAELSALSNDDPTRTWTKWLLELLEHYVFAAKKFLCASLPSLVPDYTSRSSSSNEISEICSSKKQFLGFFPPPLPMSQFFLLTLYFLHSHVRTQKLTEASMDSVKVSLAATAFHFATHTPT
jgi:hypothetical protein